MILFFAALDVLMAATIRADNMDYMSFVVGMEVIFFIIGSIVAPVTARDTLKRIVREFETARTRLHKRGVEAPDKHFDATRAAADQAIAELDEDEKKSSRR